MISYNLSVITNFLHSLIAGMSPASVGVLHKAVSSAHCAIVVVHYHLLISLSAKQ